MLNRYRKYKSLPYKPALKEKAMALRKAGVLSEVIFWNAVKRKQLFSLDFHRQKIIGDYIVDFYCAKLDLVVEIDGISHNFKGKYDESRDNYLKSLGLDVVHLSDKRILQDFDNVKKEMYEYCLERRSKMEERNTPPLQGTPLKEGNNHARDRNKNTPSAIAATPLQEGNKEMNE